MAIESLRPFPEIGPYICIAFFTVGETPQRLKSPNNHVQICTTVYLQKNLIDGHQIHHES